jgi:hypothetical protein
MRCVIDPRIRPIGSGNAQTIGSGETLPRRDKSTSLRDGGNDRWVAFVLQIGIKTVQLFGVLTLEVIRLAAPKRILRGL